MNIARVAIVYDHLTRPETTGVYCLKPLSRLVRATHFHPRNLSAITSSAFDLLLAIDDGIPYELPSHSPPIAVWAIDTHLDLEPLKCKTDRASLVFCAQHDGVARMQSIYSGPAEWLPLACDPDVHGRQNVRPRFDWCFVGNLLGAERLALLEALKQAYPNHFVGRCFFEEMARIYSESHIVFNRSIRNDLNMRVFEGLASGSLLLTNRLAENGQNELFRDGRHLAEYGEREELLDKLGFYLRETEVRERIAVAGRDEVLKNHTYHHRMQKLLLSSATVLSKTTVAMTQGSTSSGLGPKHAMSYFSHPRPDLLNCISHSARRILDIGCGVGALGKSLKERQSCEVFGIELDSTAAAIAGQSLDAVWCGDVESLDLPFGPQEFDVIVCGDVLEHLREPGRLLTTARRWLKSDGMLLASIPNVRHHSIIRTLIAGNWTYESAGILDQTHLRFFTRREVEKLFYRSQLRIRSIAGTRLPDDAQDGQDIQPLLTLGTGLRIDDPGAVDTDDMRTYQFVVQAFPAEFGKDDVTPVRPRPLGKTTIVLVTYNQWPYTHGCLESIRARTDEPYELIVVDNGSTDGTPERLASMPDVQLLRNAENRGFPAAANQGIRQARGSQVLLLNNDTLVTTGWLRRMLDALHSAPDVGLVGPCSNCVSGTQQVAVEYRQLDDLDGFAWEFGKQRHRRYASVNRLVGFCLLIERTVIERVGLLDEQFGIGNFEDDDYCLRAEKAGFRLLVAEDAFVHHFGGRTFIGSQIRYAELISRNEAIFRSKWASETGPDGRQLRQMEARPLLAEHPQGGLLVQGNTERPKLSLCMIVRDNERTLEPCLESIAPWVDEMIVVDTGSLDATVEIARRFGARVHHFSWCDDFAAARNESIRHATGEWIFWMDSDDVISPENGAKLRKIVDKPADAPITGYVMQVHCPHSATDFAEDCTVVDHVKLFRNHPNHRFLGRIHEQILPAIRAAGGDVAFTDVFVTHAGSDQTTSGLAKKLDRDLRILLKQEQETPGHPFNLFNLGMTYLELKEPEKALDYLDRSIRAAGEDESHVRKAHALAVQCLMQMERQEEALGRCQQALTFFPDDPEILFRLGVLQQHNKNHQKAIDAYEQLQRLSPSRHFRSFDAGILGHKTRQNLASAYLELGNHAKAEALFRELTVDYPALRGAWSGLVDCLIRQGRKQEASSALLPLAPQSDKDFWFVLLQADIAVANERWEEADRLFEMAFQLAQDDWECLEKRCRFRFMYRTPREAELALRDLIRVFPEDAAAWHNLGCILDAQGRHASALEALQKSLELRPDHSETHWQWSLCQERLLPHDEALLVWQETLAKLSNPEHLQLAIKRIEKLKEVSKENAFNHDQQEKLVDSAASYSLSRVGLWNSQYRNAAKQRAVYGDDLTVRKGAEFLRDAQIRKVEDWGCGLGGLKPYLAEHQKYIGVDGSDSPFADRKADLTVYRSEADAVFLRHVLEHNPQWQAVLDNALASFQHKMVLVLFTPFQDFTRVIREYPNWNDTNATMVDIGFARNDIVSRFGKLEWRCEEDVRTKTGYGVEHIYYLQRVS